MGFLRLLLAISVVADHTNSIFGWTGVGGVVAVQSFFMISGFYMAMVLSDKYVGGDKSYFLFISNRALRLFPIYWVILAASFWIRGGWSFVETFDYFGFGAKALAVLTNIFLLGQEAFFFTGVDKQGEMFLTGNYLVTNVGMKSPLLVPQAWTLSLETLFYILAPFIVKMRTRTLIVFSSASLLMRALLAYHGYYKEPWSYRFFPNEIMFFLLGILIYRFQGVSKKVFSTSWKWTMSGFVFIYAALFQFIPGNFVVKAAVFYLLFVLSLAGLFEVTKKNKVDRYIGEFSYPVYISHIFVLILISSYASGISFDFGALVLVGTLIVSFFLIYLVSNPIEKLRARRVRHPVKSNVAIGDLDLIKN